MRNFDTKSIIIGIGFGIILTAIMGLVFSAGNQGLSKSEIIAKAKAYGMIEKDGMVESIK